MSFKSLLNKSGEMPVSGISTQVPQFMVDLNIDQIINEVIHGREEYALRPIFNIWPLDAGTITYRQQILREIDHPELYEILSDFSDAMRKMRLMLKDALSCRYEFQKERLFMDSVYAYCITLRNLQEKLAGLELQSEGFRNFYQFLLEYVNSDEFTSCYKLIEELLTEMEFIKYDLIVDNLLVRVLPYCSLDNYDAKTRTLLSRFLSDNSKDYLENFPASDHMNEVEAKILKGVASLYPAIFNKIILFYQHFQDFQNKVIRDFDREIQFYVAYFEYYKKIEANGLTFCCPEMTSVQHEIFAHGIFDAALASKLIEQGKTTITNDFSLSGDQRIIFISGPNQGGKTTFARAFGQLHYFGNLGMTVAADNAKILLCDNILTHFEMSEDIQLQQSKLENDLNRVHTIIKNASSHSIIILNEIFSSTTLYDSKFLSTKLKEQIEDINAYCVWVTFIEELSTSTRSSINMSAAIDPQSAGAQRTFKIIKKDPDGRAYALSLAERYGLSFSQLIKRIRS